MNRHPSEDALLTWCETGVAPEREPLIVEHVDGCARCRERAEAMREILASMRARPLEQAPREWVEAALDAIHRNAAPHVPAPEGAGALAARARRILEEIRLALVHDSAGALELGAVRAVDLTGYRQLLFAAPPARLFVQIRERPQGGQEMRGQFTSLEEEDAPLSGRITLEHGGTRTVRKLTPGGEFQYASVRPGAMRFRVEWLNRSFVTDLVDPPGPAPRPHA